MGGSKAGVAAVGAGRGGGTRDAYQAAYDESWVKKELGVVRNVLPLVEKFGDLAGTMLSGITMWLETFGIRMPFTMKHHPANTTLYRADMMPKPDYPPPDGVLTFDRLSSLFVSKTILRSEQRRVRTE